MMTNRGCISRRSGRTAWFAGSLVAALCWCTSALADNAPRPATPASSITGISLERNGFGFPTASVLVLQRDGTATSTRMGAARQGTTDVVSKGVVRADAFDRLARLVADNGFFEMDAVYQDPALQDGPWTMTRVVRNGQEKQVFRRDEAGPAALKALEAAIERVGAQIRFVAEQR